MNIEVLKDAFLDELEKIAVTRSVKEWRAAQGAGNTAAADQIAQGAGQLGLKPRYLENISGGGMEAGVDKMMGAAGFNQAQAGQPALQQRLQQFKKNKNQLARASTQHATSAPGSSAQMAAQKQVERLGGPSGLLSGTQAPASTPAPNASGYVAQKVYKPDSPLSTGQDTSDLLKLKQQYTDKARSISPEAKEMVPAMYGHKEIQGPGGQLRHISQHEYVPGVKSLAKDQNAVAHAQKVQDVVAGPMAAKGMPIGDIARVHNGQLAGNASNVAMTASGPKVIDFLPHGQSSPVGVLQKGEHDYAMPASSGGGRLDTGYGKHNMNQLRRDVYRPSANYKPPPLPTGLPGATPVSQVSKATAAVTPAAKAMQQGAHAAQAATTVTKAVKPVAQLGKTLPAAAGAATKVTRAFKPVGQLAHAAHVI